MRGHAGNGIRHLARGSSSTWAHERPQGIRCRNNHRGAEWVVRKKTPNRAPPASHARKDLEAFGSASWATPNRCIEQDHRPEVVPGFPDKGSVSTAPAEASAEAVLPYNLPYKSRQLPWPVVVARLEHPYSDRFTPSGAVQKNPQGGSSVRFQGGVGQAARTAPGVDAAMNWDKHVTTRH